MTATTERVEARELRSTNPATLESVGSVAVTEPSEVPRFLAEARAAQERWRATSFEERRRVLGEAIRFLVAHMDEVAATVTAETGKPLAESFTSELLPAVDQARWMAANAEKVLARERLGMPQPHLLHKRAYLDYEPLGVVAIVSPWNFPLAIPFGLIATAVAAGNATLVKPSELTPLTAVWIEHAFEAAGTPGGLVRILQGDGSLGSELVRAEGVVKVFFTGSAKVGAQVAADCGALLRPVSLELGGQDPMLVFADAELDRAVDGALWGAFLNCGQVCTSVERLYVEDAVYEKFLGKLAAGATRLRLGRGEDAGTQMGPLISEAQRAHVERLVETARANGGEVIVGGRRADLELPGWFYEPTVLVGPALDEELFGPVVTVGRFGDEDEAVALANASRYGLGASVWTGDEERAQRVARRLEAGMVWTNDVAYSFGAGQAAWGGVKESGYGRTHSKHGLYECSRVKFTDLDRGRLRAPWWYPYDARLVDGFRGVLGFLYGRGVRTRLGAAWRYRRALVSLLRRYRR
ncbi:MAG: aldehyde dehydrogenase family protein [Actinomycetota bacterium]|nr:aldehyde dehydrogenase family protein [Actinomycetota bacterium]